MTIPPTRAEDVYWMKTALRLAAKGYTPPNPMVGCVLVKSGRLVAEGYHVAAGRPHAEVEALNRAGADARGATAYVNLEPCSHFGRTPPCAAALIDAGISRVYVGAEDPNPVVSGRGISGLRQAGIEVHAGLLEIECKQLNEAFFYFHAVGRPFVTLKAAVSLDGKTATRTGDSRWITGVPARRHVHKLRGQSGAVLCGIGTVLKDDPLLTARLPGIPRQPVRIVLDASLRLPLDSQLVKTAAEVPAWVATTEAASVVRAKELASLGVEILRIPADRRGWIALRPLLDELGRREITSLLVEGGGTVHSSFVASGEFQRLLWFVAPKFIGGSDAPTSVEGIGALTMAEAIGLQNLKVRRLGQDLLIESSPDPEEKK